MNTTRTILIISVDIFIRRDSLRQSSKKENKTLVDRTYHFIQSQIEEKNSGIANKETSGSQKQNSEMKILHSQAPGHNIENTWLVKLDVGVIRGKAGLK